jgi:hypothetical protein
MLIARIALATLMLTTAARSATAALSFGVGADYASGPGTQSVRDVLGYLQSSWTHADVTVAAARFRSSQVGTGTNGTLAFTWTASPKLSLQLMGARAAAESDYRASRFQAGPVVPFGGGTWGVYFLRAEDTIGPSTTGLATEAAVPLGPMLIATGRGSLASVEGGGTNVQGAAGLIWGASKRVLLVGELGMGRDATALAPSAPAPGGVGITGRHAGSAPDYVSGPALSVGIRYVIR